VTPATLANRKYSFCSKNKEEEEEEQEQLLIKIKKENLQEE